MEKVRWGVISTAKIGTEKVLPGLMRARHCDVQAIASRSLDSARAAADALGIPRAYGSYEELLADPEIEAIYNPLPNHLHVPWTLKAAAAGKHVLCEKPVGLDADDAARLREIRGVHVMEAFMVRFHPQWLKARELVRAGAVGTVRGVQAFFSYHNVDPGNIRNMADIGGGAALDIGCYPIVVTRFVLDADPVRVMALVDRDPGFGTDRTTSALVDFGEGRHLTFTASTQCVPYQRVQICGTTGRIEMRIPFNAPQGETTVICTDDGSSLAGGGVKEIEIAACDQYAEEGDAFSRIVRGEESPVYGVEDAVLNMRILDALFRSEKSERWEMVAG